jgi:hypothetical protein
LLGIDWDTLLDAASTRRWTEFQAELPGLEKLRILRWIAVDAGTESSQEIHGFADASERAYAAVVYLRVFTGDSWTANIVAAKSKVAPLKPVSLPCLELSAATLLVRLVNHVRAAISLERAPVHLWSDSTVALA